MQALEQITRDRPLHQTFPLRGPDVILSENVTICRGPGDDYPAWTIGSAPPIDIILIHTLRGAKLRRSVGQDVYDYVFEYDRQIVEDQLRNALYTAAQRRYNACVISNIGLEGKRRHSPQILADTWRKLILFDPFVRGQLQEVIFVFEDGEESTTKQIVEAEKHRNRSHARPRSVDRVIPKEGEADIRIDPDKVVFDRVFDDLAIADAIALVDDKYKLAYILN